MHRLKPRSGEDCTLVVVCDDATKVTLISRKNKHNTSIKSLSGHFATLSG